MNPRRIEETLDRARLLEDLRAAEEALLDAEAELAQARRVEARAAARVNTAALCAATLHRALEALDEVPGARVH